MKICRLCLSQHEQHSNLSDIHEGFPLSIIAMVICPVKIDLNDKLPKSICGKCVEILVASFKLRDTIVKSDIHLRGLESAGISEIPLIAVKQEPEVDCGFTIVQEPSGNPSTSGLITHYLGNNVQDLPEVKPTIVNQFIETYYTGTQSDPSEIQAKRMKMTVADDTSDESEPLPTMIKNLQHQVSGIGHEVWKIQDQLTKMEKATDQRHEQIFSQITSSSKTSKESKPSRVSNLPADYEVMKPKNFPDNLKCSTIEEFDTLQKSVDPDTMFYAIYLFKKTLKETNTPRKFLRLGLNMLMTPELQVQCSFTGRGGERIDNHSFVTWLLIACGEVFNATNENLRQIFISLLSDKKSKGKLKA